MQSKLFKKVELSELVITVESKISVSGRLNLLIDTGASRSVIFVSKLKNNVTLNKSSTSGISGVTDTVIPIIGEVKDCLSIDNLTCNFAVLANNIIKSVTTF